MGRGGEGKRRRKGGSKKGVWAPPPIFTTDRRHWLKVYAVVVGGGDTQNTQAGATLVVCLRTLVAGRVGDLIGGETAVDG